MNDQDHRRRAAAKTVIVDALAEKHRGEVAQGLRREVSAVGIDRTAEYLVNALFNAKLLRVPRTADKETPGGAT